MRPVRSFLFVPGDSDRKIAKASACAADALILDLEDSVAADRKAAAREAVAAFLRESPAAGRGKQFWVRINPLDEEAALDDLAAVAGLAPDGIVLPKATGPEDVLKLSHWLDGLEAASGLRRGAIAVLPVATETAAAPFGLGAYATAALPRLYGLTWGAEDLSAELGADSNRDPDGRWAQTYQVVRSLCLMAARAAGAEPVETLHADFRDEAGLQAGCLAAASEGFTGRLAIHPGQVGIINECFTPAGEAVAAAERVVAAFAAEPGKGTVGLDGQMLDRPHLLRAERLLARARAFAPNS